MEKGLKEIQRGRGGGREHVSAYRFCVVPMTDIFRHLNISLSLYSALQKYGNSRVKFVLFSVY